MRSTAGSETAGISRHLWVMPFLAFGAVATVVGAVLVVGHQVLGWTEQVGGTRFPVPDGFFGAWYRGDSLWYLDVATEGYTLDAAAQSNVVFLPGQSLLVRAVGNATGAPAAAGVLTSLACGLASVVLLWRWLTDHLRGRTGVIALALFLLYPYALFLYGPVYAEPLTLVGILGAFLLVERDRPALAGLAGGVATASRLVGIAVVPALVVAILDRRGAFDPDARGGWRGALGRLRPADTLVLLAAAGLLGYLTFLWVRFDDPLVMVRAEKVSGWEEGLSWHSLLKIEMFRGLAEYPQPTRTLLVLQIALTIGFVALLPRVWRRFGPAYGTYTALVIGIPFVLSHDAYSMGRYLLLAFPVFAVVAEHLEERPAVLKVTLACSAMLLLLNTALYGDGYFVA